MLDIGRDDHEAVIARESLCQTPQIKFWHVSVIVHDHDQVCFDVGIQI